MNLEQIRHNIDTLDRELVALLEKRMDLVNQVAAYKKETGKPILDRSREEAVLRKVETLVNNQEYKTTIRATFEEIMAHSRNYQAKKLGLEDENI